MRKLPILPPWVIARSVIAFLLFTADWGRAQSFLGDVIIYDAFEDGSSFSNPDGSAWVRTTRLGISGLPTEEIGSGFCFLPGGSFTGAGYAFSNADDTVALNDPANSFVFEWVTQDAEVTSRSTGTPSRDYRFWFGVQSKDVSRTERPLLFHTNDGGIVGELFLNSDTAGETEATLLLQSADETNLANNVDNVATHFSQSFDPAVFGESNGIWSSRRLAIRLELTNTSGGVYAYQLTVINELGETAMDQTGTLDVGTDFDNGAFPFFAAGNSSDGKGTICIEEFSVIRKPVEGMAFLTGRAWQDVNADDVRGIGEAGLPGVPFQVIPASGNPESFRTGSDGYFSVPVKPGSYTLEFETPSGYDFVAKDAGADDRYDSDIDPATGRSIQLTLADDGSALVELGLRRTGFLPVVPGGGMLAYEGFDYPADASLQDLDGGEGVLWAGAWRGLSSRVREGNLCNPDLPPVTGRRLDVAGRPVRSLTQRLGDDGTEVYVSWLMFLNSNAAADGYVRFHDGGDNVNGHVASVGFDLSPAQAYMAETGPFGALDDRRFLAKFDHTNKTRLFVVRFSFGNGDQDTMDTWMDPEPGTDFSLASDRVFGTDLGFDRVVFWGFKSIKPIMDEFRIGSTPADVLNANFFPDPVGISGFVWQDLNGNGIQDLCEPALRDVVVSLLDDNGTQVPGPSGSTTSDNNGRYLFTDPAPGTYSLQFTKPDDFVSSPADQVPFDIGDSDVHPGTDRSSPFSFAAGNAIRFDAGYYPEPKISGRAWDDLNSDGLQDPAEPGLSGVPVNLLALDGSTIRTVATDSGGEYSFGGLSFGDYFVSFPTPAGRFPSPKDQGGDDAMDSDIGVETGRSPTITLNPGDQSVMDAGFYASGLISGRAWDDLNHNGIEEAGEPGFGGLPIELLLIEGEITTSTASLVTAGNGTFAFSNLDNGNYQLSLTLPPDRSPSPHGQGNNPQTDSDLVVTETTSSVFAIIPGTSVQFDVGLLPPPAPVTVQTTAVMGVAEQIGSTIEFNFPDLNSDTLEISFECQPVGTTEQDGVEQPYFPEFQMQESFDLQLWSDFGPPIAQQVGGSAGRKTITTNLMRDSRAYYRIVLTVDDSEFAVNIPPAPSPVLLPLSGSGQPEGGSIGSQPDGSLAPFAYAPQGNGGSSEGGLRFQFPDGATIIEEAVGDFIEFNSIEVGFGSDSIWSLDLEGTPAEAFASGGIRIDLPKGETARLEIGVLSYGDLADLLGIPREEGIPLKLYRRYPLRWMGGTITKHGIEGARFGLGELGLPLPTESGDYPQLVTPLNATDADGKVRLSAFGASDVGSGALMTTSRESPFAITLSSGGQISVNGLAILKFANGFELAARVLLDGGNFCFEIRSNVVELELLLKLAQILPGDPAQCVPGDGGEDEIDEAEACLRNFHRVYEKFIQSSGAAAVVEGETDSSNFSSIGSPPDALTGASEVGALAAAIAQSPDPGQIPMSDILALAKKMHTEAPTVDTCLSAVQQVEAAVDLLQALAVLELNGVAQAETGPVRTELVAAMGILVEKLKMIVRQREPLTSKQCANDSVTILARSAAKLQAINLDNFGLLSTAQALTIRIGKDYARTLGVKDGVTDYRQNQVIEAMDRFTVFDQFATAQSLVVAGAAAGVPIQNFTLMEELTAQLFGLAADQTEAEARAAIIADNPTAFLIAFGEMTDVLEFGVQSELQGIPDYLDLIAAISELTATGTALFDEDAQLPPDQRSLSDTRLAIRTLANIALKITDSSLGSWVGPIQRVHTEMATTLQEAITTLEGAPIFPGNASDSERAAEFETLRELLQAGAAYMRLARRIDGVDNPYDWEQQGLAVIATRLAALKDFAKINQALGFLFKEVDLLEKETAEAIANPGLLSAPVVSFERARLDYFFQMAVILDGVRDLIIEDFLPGLNTLIPPSEKPEEERADVKLPGELRIVNAGGFLCYNYTRDEWSGGLRGTLFFPRWASSLTISGASFANGGEFDLAAHGFVLMPTLDPHAKLEITPERPLHIFYHESEGFGVEGRARLSFDNGVFFETTVKAADPIYAFELVAGGFQFTFEKELAEAVTRLDDIEQDEMLAPEQIRRWNEFYSSLTNTLQPRFPGNFPADDPSAAAVSAGTNFSLQTEDLPTQAELLSKLIKAEDFKGDVPNHIESLEKINELIRNLDPGLQEDRSLFQVVTDFFSGQAPEATFAQEAAQLEKIVSSYRELAAGIKIMDRVITQGGGAADSFDINLLQTYLDQSTLQLIELMAKLRDPESPSFPLLANRDITSALATTASELILAYNELNFGSPPGGLDEAFLTAWTEDSAKVYLRTIGFGTRTEELPGVIIETFGPNLDMINTYSFDEAQRNLNRYLEVLADLAIVGSSNQDLARSESHIRAMLNRMILQSFILDFGYDADAGGPIGQFFPENALRLRLMRGLERMLALGGSHFALLNENLTFPNEFIAKTLEMRAILIARLNELAPNQVEDRIATQEAISAINALRGFNDELPLTSEDDVVKADFEQVAAAMSQRLSSAEISSRKLFIRQMADNVTVRNIYAERLRAAADEIEALVSVPWTQTDIPLARELCAELRAMDELMIAIGRDQFSLGQQPDFLLQGVRERLVTVAVERNDPLPLSVFADCLLNAAEGRLNQARRRIRIPDAVEQFGDPELAPPPPQETQDKLREEAGTALNEAQNIAKQFSLRIIDEETEEQTSGDDNPNTPKDAELPAGITIKRIAGALMFNRETGYLKGAFGGRIEFPDPRAFFEIDQATIDSDGAYSIIASTQIPLDPNGDGSLTVAGRVDIAGDTEGLDHVSGAGLLTFRENPNADPLIVNANISYLPDLPGRPLRFSGGAEGLEDVTRIGNDFVLFGGQATVEFSTENPGAFAVSLGTSVGLFGKTNPLPDDRPLTPEDFYVIVNVPELALQVDQAGTQFTFSGGEILLSEPFRSEDGTGDSRTRPRILIDTPLCVRHDAATDTIEICTPDGQPYVVALRNVSFPIPGIDGMRVNIDNAELRLGDGTETGIHNLDGTIQIPLPGDDASDPGKRRTVDIGITGKRWNFDRFPEGLTITLENDVRIADFNGFTIDLLGSTEGQTSIGFTSDEIGGETVTTFHLTGAMRMGMHTDILRDADTGNAFAITAVSSFSWNLRDLPEFSFPVLQAEGRFKLGGDEGLVVSGIDGNPLAQIRIENLENLWNQAPDRAFKLLISGTLEVGGLASFGMVDTGFVLDGRGGPVFQTGGFEVGAGERTLEAIAGLPIYVSNLGFRFNNPSLPLLPADGSLGLFSRENVRLIVSGGINLPSREAIDSGSPGISGQVQDLEISFRENGGNIEPVFNTNGFGMQIENLDIGPLVGLTGGLFVGNLNFPDQLYFAGVVGGKLYKAKVEVMLAIDKNGLIGTCFEIDGGEVGIPIDSGALGGLMLTGVTGGVNFQNGFVDPCKFLDFIAFQQQSDGTQAPVNDMSADVFETDDPGDPGGEVTSRPWEHCLLDSVGGTFPVNSVNPLCEPHPSIPGRVVYKGTVMTPSQLANLGITPATVPDDIDEAAAFVAQQLLGALAAPFTEFGVPPISDLIQAKSDELIAGFSDVAAVFVRAAINDSLDDLGGAPTGASNYEIIEQVAAVGIPCKDITLRIQGNLTHALAPGIVKGSVGATVSTTGTVAMDGEIRIGGINAGRGDFVFQITDQNGGINPSFGGLVDLSLGPFEFGSTSMGYLCEECVGPLDIFDTFLAQPFPTDDAAVKLGLVKLMDEVLPDGAPRSPLTPISDHYNALIFPQKLAYVAALTNLVEQQAQGNSAETERIFGPNGDQLTDLVIDRYVEFVTDAQVSANPVFCFRQDVAPKLFGWSLTGGAEALYRVETTYVTRKLNKATNEVFSEFSANVGFSPSYMTGQLLMGPTASLVPATPSIDFSEFGFSFRQPAMDAESVRLSMADPIQYYANQAAALVEEAVITYDYRLTPFGMKLANGQGRVLMPRLLTHPARPGADWQEPSGGSLATRAEVILAALTRDRVKDASWRGDTGELDDLFFDPFQPNLTGCEFQLAEIRDRIDQGAMSGLSLAHDYFPYGGLIGAAELDLPNFISQLPPPETLAIFTVPTTLSEAEAWLSAGDVVLNQYLLGTTCAGQLALHLPAPNPPFLLNEWNTATAEDLITAISDGDFDGIVNRTTPDELYAYDQILLEGWIEAQLLGLPLARAEARFVPEETKFEIRPSIPPATWLADYVGVQGDALIELFPPRYLEDGHVVAPEEVITGDREAIADRLAARSAAMGSMTAQQIAGDGGAFAQATIAEICESLPRASMHVNATVPDDIGQFVRGGAGVEFFAFSFGFEPDFTPGDFSPYAVARREGGMGVRGNFQIGYFPDQGDPFAIDVQDLSFAIRPPADPTAQPNLAAQVQLSDVQIPGLATIRNASLLTNTAPANGEPHVSLAGEVDPFFFGLGNNIELLRFESLNPGEPVGGRFSVVRNDAATDGVDVDLEIDAMRATMPALGQDVGIYVYGNGTELPGGELTPLQVNASENETWQATVCLASATSINEAPTFAMCNPFDPGSPCLVSFTPTGPICGKYYGRGSHQFWMEATVEGGAEVTFFPGQEAETVLPIDINNTFRFYADSRGRFYFDFGDDLSGELPGALTASGHFSFGFNPGETDPNVFASPTSLNFGPIDAFQSATLPIDISNFGGADANILIHVSPRSHYSVNQPGFRVSPGITNEVDVIFHPTAAGVLPGQLIIESNDPSRPKLIVPLSGEGIAAPEYYQSRSLIDFGDTLVGGSARGTVNIGNTGLLPMNVTSITVTDPNFSVQPTIANATVKAGASLLVTVAFNPIEHRAYAGQLVINTANAGTHTVDLSGVGGDSRWIPIHDGTSLETGKAAFNDIQMLDARRGWVVGENGVLLETENGGRSWIDHKVTKFDLHDIAVQSDLGIESLREYHFEGAPGTGIFRDDSGNGSHATAPAAFRMPALSFANGRFGSGLSFDGVNDYIEIPDFGVPDRFSISLWVNPETTDDGQAFISRNGVNNSTDFVFGFYNGVYRLFFLSEGVSLGTKQAGWQHLTLTFTYDSTADTTLVRVHRDGIQLGLHSFSGKLPAAAKPWSLGQEWDNPTRASDFFGGLMDEVYFFNGILSDNQRAILGNGSLRMALAGDGGMVFTSSNLGASWSQLPDQRILGWRQDRGGVFDDHLWLGASFADDGRLLLGGQRNGSERLLMIENGGDLVFDGSAGNSAGEFLTSTFTTNGHLYAVGSRGVPYEANSLSSSWFREGTIDVGQLNAATATTNLNYVGVGNSGTIVRRFNANPVISGAGDTNFHLRGITYNPALSESLHVVGDGGVYMTSDNLGEDWNVAGDGLAGENRAIATAGAGANYEAWAVGRQSGIGSIKYRPEVAPSGPFVAFSPGELDFGFLQVGKSRTLPAKIYNRGNADLSLDNIQISGAGFSIVQGSVSTVAPGDVITLQVRYRPTVPSTQDLGQLVLATNDGGQSFAIPLRGRASTLEWAPADLGVEGHVVDIVFTSDTQGYAIVASETGSRFFSTVNGGLQWFQQGIIVGPPLAAGEKLDIRAMDFVPGGPDGQVGCLAGAVLSSDGTFLRGIVLRSNGGAWIQATPIQSQNLVFEDIDIYDQTLETHMVAVTSDPAGNGDVWQTENGGQSWQNKTRRPDFFNGSFVAVVPNVLGGFTTSAIVTGSDNFIYSRQWPNNWFALPGQNASPGHAFNPTQIVRDFDYFDDPDISSLIDSAWMVGDNGLFWRLESAAFFPAANAEVFGTSNLSGVSFHDGTQGWVVGESKIFISNDKGQSWDLNLDAGEASHFGTVHARAEDLAWAGGSVAGKAVIWRYRGANPAAQGVLAVNDVEIFQPTTKDGVTSKLIALSNIGTGNVDIHQMKATSPDRIPRFRVTGQVPDFLAPGETVNVEVSFDAKPEPPIVELLQPEVFLRFEQDAGTAEYVDDSIHHRSATPAPVADQRPKIVEGFQGRDRCLQFAGDYAEIDPSLDDIEDEFTISLWVNPDSTGNSRFFFGKHSASGANLILCGLHEDGYYFNIRNQTHSAGEQITGWQHLVITGQRIGDQTQVTFFRNGHVLWSELLDAIVGNVGGKPWILGAERDGNSSINDFYFGCIDDFAIFNETFGKTQVNTLGQKSPLYGEHRATLAINSGTEGGQSSIDLRAEVVEEGGLLVIDTEPSNVTITVDGEEVQTPFAVSVGSTANSDSEWCIGSLHRISVPENFQVSPDGRNVLDYSFRGFDHSGEREIEICASKSVTEINARFIIDDVRDLTNPLPGFPTPDRNVTGDGDALRAEVTAALVGAPSGAFFRVSNGRLAVPGLSDGQVDFIIDGELHLTPQSMNASVNVPPVQLPGGKGTQFLEIGQTHWLLDVEFGSIFTLKARPSSVNVLGVQVLAGEQLCFEYDPQNVNDPNDDIYRFAIGIERDMRIIPDVLHFGPGESAPGRFEVNFEPEGMTLDWTGSVRVLKLPDGNFAIDEEVQFSDISTTNFTIGLKDVLAAAGASPPGDTLLELGPVRFDWPNGDLNLIFDDSVRVELANVDFFVADEQILENVTASAGLDGTLSLKGELQDFPLHFGGVSFFIDAEDANDEFEFTLHQQADNPTSMTIRFPDFLIDSTLEQWPAGGIAIGGFVFEPLLEFDTGQIPLPVGISFDGIDLASTEEDIANNHVRFRATLLGDYEFGIAAEIPLPTPDPLDLPFIGTIDFDCTPHLITFGITPAGINGSLTGNFCILKDEVSIGYKPNNANGCIFEGSANGWLLGFGPLDCFVLQPIGE